MKMLSSVIILGIGLFLCSGGTARAQWGEMGEAAKKGAADAAKQELLKGAGVPTPEATAATPAAETGAVTPAAEEPNTTPAAEAPAGEPGADTGAPKAPAGEAEVAPEAAEAPAAAPAEDVEKMIKDKAGDKVQEEGAKKMMPKP